MSIASTFAKQASERIAKLAPKEQAYVAKVLQAVGKVEQKAQVLSAAGEVHDSLVLSDWAKSIAAAPKSFNETNSKLGELVYKSAYTPDVQSFQRQLRQTMQPDSDVVKALRNVNRNVETRKTGEYALNLQKAIANLTALYKKLDKDGSPASKKAADDLYNWLKVVSGKHEYGEYDPKRFLQEIGPVNGNEIVSGIHRQIDVVMPEGTRYTPGVVQKLQKGTPELERLSLAEAKELVRSLTSDQVSGQPVYEAIRQARRLP